MANIKINEEKAIKTQRFLKSILAIEGLSLTDLAKLITENCNRSEIPQTISQKLKRGTIKYIEMEEIANLLGYDIEWIKRKI